MSSSSRKQKRSAVTAAAPLEVADIVRAHGSDFLAHHRTSPAQRRVLKDLACCRTATLGGHVERCDSCSHERIAYNSCRNRHCPKCQGSVAAQWMQDRAQELLNVPYFHVVFTLPDCIAALALQNPRIIYDILFRAASQTLLEVAANPKHLGAKIGFLAVLHTWGQNLHFHPHLHCVVPAGGLSFCGKKWINAKKDFFLPVRILSRVFQGKFIAQLKQAYQRGDLQLSGSLARLVHGGAWQHWLNVAVRSQWVVYAKPPFGGPQVVLKYLARYTHRVAISNRRLIQLQDGHVTFSIKNYAKGGARGILTLTAEEFLRRLLMHVLPKGFMRIRHFGFLSNRFRRQMLKRCRDLLQIVPETSKRDEERSCKPQHTTCSPEPALQRCPACQQGRLSVTVLLRSDPPHSRPYHTRGTTRHTSAKYADTS